MPKLSSAFSEIVSTARLLSVSLSDPRAAFTCVSVPLMVRVVLLEPVTVAPPPPEADSRPLVSVSVTVNVSLTVAPVSEMLTPEIVSDLPTPTVVVLGAAMTGGALTVTDIVCCVAVPPRPSAAFRKIVSPPGVLSVSVRLARSVFTWERVPLITRVVVPVPVMVPPPVADSRPLVSCSVIVMVSPALTASESATLTPLIAVAIPLGTVCGPGTVIDGGTLTFTVKDF